MRETVIESACGHLASALAQCCASDDQIIMDHDPTPAEARLADRSTE